MQTKQNNNDNKQGKHILTDSVDISVDIKF